MQSVVDVLMKPSLDYTPYNSFFDRYSCAQCPSPFPGYVDSQSIVTSKLLPDLANGSTKQLFSYSHGSATRLANAANNIYLNAKDVGTVLGNSDIYAANPYRFVFLDGCSTASQSNWRMAFGITPLETPSKVARSNIGPQAYVGGAKTITHMFGGFRLTGQSGNDPVDSSDLAQEYTQLLAEF